MVENEGSLTRLNDALPFKILQKEIKGDTAYLKFPLLGPRRERERKKGSEREREREKEEERRRESESEREIQGDTAYLKFPLLGWHPTHSYLTESVH